MRRFADPFGEFRYDLLMEPDIHLGRAIECASIMKLFRKLFAGCKAAVEIKELHQIDD